MDFYKNQEKTVQSAAAMKFSDIKRRKLSFFNNSNNNKNRQEAAAAAAAAAEAEKRPASAPVGGAPPQLLPKTPAVTAGNRPRSSCDSSPTSSIGDTFVESGRDTIFSTH